MSAAELSWQDYGLCQYTDPDLFFPEKGNPADAAKRICEHCEVRRQCLAYALTTPVNPAGVWGGLSERERRGPRRQLGRAA